MAVPSSSSRGAQMRCVQCTSASRGSSLLFTKEPLLSLAVFCCFKSFKEIISPSSIFFPFLFFFCRLGSRCKPKGEGRRGKGWAGGSWVCGTSLDNAFFLPGLRPLLGFKAIFSSSSELMSIRVTKSLGEWAVESLSKSASEFESSTGLSDTPSSSSKWNWSMSASREKHEEAVSYLGAATSLGECGGGSSTGGRSL